MKITYLFSRNEKIGSKLIAWASGLLIKDLDRVPSHVAILLDEDKGLDNFVVESVLESGVRIIPYSVWLSKNEECYAIPCSVEYADVTEVFDKIKHIWNKAYDWPGILYFAYSFILHLTLNVPFSKENKWEDPDRFFCTEAAGILSGYNKYSMTTPAKMCSDFLKDIKHG